MKASGQRFADPTYIMPKTRGRAGVGVSGLISNPAKFSQIRLLRLDTVTQTSTAHFKCGSRVPYLYADFIVGSSINSIIGAEVHKKWLHMAEYECGNKRLV